MGTRFESRFSFQGGRDRRADQSLGDWTYNQIWRDLVTWRYRPSDILVEEQLAETFHTSRTPIQESLKKLTEGGFLRVVPRTGYVVLPVTLTDVHEAIHVRLLLEREAAAMAAARLTDDAVDAFECWWVGLERTILESGDEYDAVEASIVILDLHVQIARASGSQRLAHLIETVIIQTAREVLDPKAIGDRDFAVAQHRILQEAILRRDADEARAAVTRHLEDYKARLLEALISEPGKTAISVGPAVR